ncbi:MAG: hypothetical protein C0501_13755 [Isosphaera sp.]|nr:hypothetical protein [Isosphaera sp.]
MLLSTARLDRRGAARRAGFTLLEVLVVVAILVILAGVASVATLRYLDNAKKSRAQLQAKTIAQAVQAYITDPQNPSNEPPQSLEVLAQTGTGGTAFLKDGAESLIDPWGQQFQVKAIQGRDGAPDYLIYTVAKNDGTPISQYGVGAALSRVNE